MRGRAPARHHPASAPSSASEGRRMTPNVQGRLPTLTVKVSILTVAPSLTTV